MAIGRAAMLAGQATHYRQEAGEQAINADAPLPPDDMEPLALQDRIRALFVMPETVLHSETVARLSELAVVTTLANYSGMIEKMPPGISDVAQSLAHPVLGYAGAWAATLMDRQPAGKIRGKIALLGATVANFLTETVQSHVLARPEYVNFMAADNILETFKDYGFALGGMALFLYHSRRNSSSD